MPRENVYENDIEKIIFDYENKLYYVKSEYMGKHHLNSNDILSYESQIKKLQNKIKYLHKALENGVDYLSDLSILIENKISSSM